MHPSGLWYGEYALKTCRPRGEPSSYSDGEALLALVKAAKYLNKKDLLPVVMSAAAAGKRENVDNALAADSDSDVTKGYYQWSSMAFYELATSDFPDTRSYGDTVLRLADWMVDVHDVLNVFQVTGLNSDDQYFMRACPAKPGDYLEFFAEIDLLCAISACPGGDLSVPLWGPDARDPIDVCRPLGVEVYAVDSRLLVGWKPPEVAVYGGAHGMRVERPAWEG